MCGARVELTLTEQRQQAHSLLDVLPGAKLAAVHSLLEVIVEPLSYSLAMAPVDEEELSDEMIARLAESRKSLDAGDFVSHEDILREFGL
jgi:hypothetical protein